MQRSAVCCCITLIKCKKIRRWGFQTNISTHFSTGALDMQYSRTDICHCSQLSWKRVSWECAFKLILQQNQALTLATVLLASRHLNIIYIRNDSFPNKQGVMLLPKGKKYKYFSIENCSLPKCLTFDWDSDFLVTGNWLITLVRPGFAVISLY